MNLSTKKKIDLYLGGTLVALLKPLVMLAGNLLKRNHDIKPKSEILFIKMLGGGSLLIALPALLGLKKKYSMLKFKLITTAAVKPFAHCIGVFDEIIVINDHSIFSLATSGFNAIRKILRIDTVIDLEVYSFLSVILSLLTLARNRIGFYLENTFWRKNLFTHLIFLNRFSGIFFFYEEIALRLGASIATHDECRKHLIAVNKLQLLSTLPSSPQKVSIGHGCSENGQERMLTTDQWVKVVQQEKLMHSEINFLGSSADFVLAEKIIEALKKIGVSSDLLKNHCGKCTLQQSLQILYESHLFIGVDSSLLHFARALGIQSVSFFGPTDPSTRLKPDPNIIEKIHYHKIPCSPCIHVTETPPCLGDNICIKKIFNEQNEEQKFHSFLINVMPENEK